MNNFEIFLLAVAMSIDAFIVSFSYGLILKTSRLKNSLKLSVSFAFFQFIMPILGWFSISLLYKYIMLYSKWIVFTVFLLLSVKFIQEAFEKKDSVCVCGISFLCLLSLSLATSIDAFASGVNIKLSGNNIIYTSTVIGIITLINSYIGFSLSSVFQKISSKYINILGSLMLLYLAVKSVI